MLILLNFRSDSQILDLSKMGVRGQVVLLTALNREGFEDLSAFHLRPDEGIIIS